MPEGPTGLAAKASVSDPWRDALGHGTMTSCQAVHLGAPPDTSSAEGEKDRPAHCAYASPHGLCQMATGRKGDLLKTVTDAP